MSDTAVRTIAWKLLLTFYEAKEKLLKKKREEEGKKSQEEWYADIYNKNVENWKLLTDYFYDYIGKRDDVKNEVSELKAAVTKMSTSMESLTKAVNTAVKNCKPSGVYIFGKHIFGWYFFPFMLLVFIFLGLFGYEAFHMRDEAIQANVKLQVIREDFGHHPAVARTFHMLDSLYDNPIPAKAIETSK